MRDGGWSKRRLGKAEAAPLASVIASEAKQSSTASDAALDCFVAAV